MKNLDTDRLRNSQLLPQIFTEIVVLFQGNLRK